MADAPSSSFSRLVLRLGLLAASLVFVLLLAELAMRIVGVGQIMTYVPDPRFGYLMRPLQIISTYGDPVEINALGLRGPPVLDPKPPDVLRVLFLGDSITYGGGRIYEGALFCRVVEALARDDGFRLEAVNVSAPGWSPQNWTAWVEANGLLGANLVVVVLPAVDRARPFGTLDASAMVERKPLLRLSTLWLRARGVVFRSQPYTDDSLNQNVRATERLKSLAGARPLVAMFLPSNEHDPRPDRWEPYQALFPNALDLRGKFTPEDYLDTVHFSAHGHRAIADALYAYLRPILAELTTRGARGGT